MNKAVVYAGTRNVYKDMCPSVKSLLAHNDIDVVYFLIEDDVFPYELPDVVKCINVSKQRFFRVTGPNYQSAKTYMTMMRTALCKLFPELDRVLWLDIDTIVLGDISKLWELPLDDYYFAATKEIGRSTEKSLYTNVGVSMYNLEKMRDGMADQVINALNSKIYRFLEQDALNEFCRGYIFDMPSEYNANEYTEKVENPKIIHFAATPGWQNLPIVREYADLSLPVAINHADTPAQSRRGRRKSSALDE